MQMAESEVVQNSTQSTDKKLKKKGQLIIKGIDVILQSNAIKNNQVPFNQNFRVIYSQVEKQIKLKRKSQQIISISVYQGVQTIKNVPAFSKEIPIENFHKSFNIGSLKNENVLLSYNHKKIQATIIFNEIHLNDQQIEPIEAEVSIQNDENKNLRKTCTDYLSKEIIKITDVRKQQNFENFMQIANYSNNRILKQGEKFKLQFSYLFVDRIYKNLQEFLKEFQMEGSKSKRDFIYDALQNLP